MMSACYDGDGVGNGWHVTTAIAKSKSDKENFQLPKIELPIRNC